jgi:hypothetical protein
VEYVNVEAANVMEIVSIVTMELLRVMQVARGEEMREDWVEKLFVIELIYTECYFRNKIL